MFDFLPTVSLSAAGWWVVVIAVVVVFAGFKSLRFIGAT